MTDKGALKGKESLSRYYGGSAEATEENLDYFIKKLRELHQKGTKFTFRQWTRKMMTLLDLID